MKYKVTQEGVNALRVLVYKLAEGVGLLNKASRSLNSEIQNNQAGAGPHYQEINSLIEEINGIISKIDEPVDSVSESITELADAYEEIIGTPLYSGDSSITATPFSGSSFLRGGAFSAGMSMTGSSSGSGGTFEGMKTGTLPNGEHAVMGNNYERFVSEYYGSGLTEECTRIDGDPVVETIDPADVEGISFTDREMSNPDIFWNMRGYPKDNYLEIASHIPEVQQQLDQGKNLEEICSDPNLKTCAVLYFDPQNMVSAEKSGPYYTIAGGRHRVLAARILGIRIPIRIKSIRTYH